MGYVCFYYGRIPRQELETRRRIKAKAPSAVEDETRTTQMGLNHEPRHRNKLETC